MVGRMLRSEVMYHKIKGSLFLSTLISLLSSQPLSYPKCHTVIVLLDKEQHFQKWGIYFYSTAGLPKVT
jgi:hypothetical protein